MNRARAVIVTAFGLMAGACTCVGETGPATLILGGNIIRPSTNPTFAQRRMNYPVVSVATRVTTLPRSTIAVTETSPKPLIAAVVRTYVVRSPQSEAMAPRFAANQPAEALPTVRRVNADAVVASPSDSQENSATPDQPTALSP
jgi:hypothetical protein